MAGERSATPFARYPGGGRVLLGAPAGGDGTARLGYGVPAVRQCGTACAYCQRDLGSTYEGWLDLTIDHVVPMNAVNSDIPREWLNDLANIVTCCAACNGFLNRYVAAISGVVTQDDFFELRDQCFHEKCDRAMARHVKERERFEKFHAAIGP